MHTWAGGYSHDKPMMGTTNGHLRKTQVTDLPPELLSIIFKFIHDNMIPIWLEKKIIPEGFEQLITALIHPTIPEHSKVKSPSLFLYSLAAVCSFWHNVLCTSWILDPCCPLYQFQVNAACGCFTFLGVVTRTWYQCFYYVPRWTSPNILPGSTWKMPDRCFLHILKPHLHHCHSLYVNAHSSSSYPRIYKRFNGIQVPHLKSMEWVCEVHKDDKNDGDSNGDSKNEFEPDLRCLIIDRKNFCKHLEELNNWMDRHMPLKQLTIMQYKTGKNNGYSFQDFLTCINAMDFLQVEQLKLERLQFASCPLDIDHLVSRSQFVHLEDVSEAFIEGISYFAHFTDFPFYASLIAYFLVSTLLTLCWTHWFSKRSVQMSICWVPSLIGKGKISGLTIATLFQVCFSKCWQASYVTGSENAKFCEFSPEIYSTQFRKITIGAQDENPVGEPSMTKESKKSTQNGVQK